MVAYRAAAWGWPTFPPPPRALAAALRRAALRPNHLWSPPPGRARGLLLVVENTPAPKADALRRHRRRERPAPGVAGSSARRAAKPASAWRFDLPPWARRRRRRPTRRVLAARTWASNPDAPGRDPTKTPARPARRHCPGAAWPAHGRRRRRWFRPATAASPRPPADPPPPWRCAPPPRRAVVPRFSPTPRLARTRRERQLAARRPRHRPQRRPSARPATPRNAAPVPPAPPPAPPRPPRSAPARSRTRCRRRDLATPPSPCATPGRRFPVAPPRPARGVCAPSTAAATADG